jgi:4a-hydroxytetrahydrobiopterin dehydratase
MPLIAERCEACHKDAPRVPADQESALLLKVPEWRLIEVDGVKRLQRTFRVKGWLPAVAFTSKVAASADAEDHHPAILIEWGKVTVTWWTHAIKGLHRNDFIMAAKTDEIFSQS